MAEKWPWPPESIENLALEDFFEHADVARAMADERAKEMHNRPGKRRTRPASSFT